MPLQVWSSLHQLHWESLRNVPSQVPPQISELGYGIHALTCLLCVSVLTTISEPLLEKIFFRLAFFQPCSIGNEYPGIQWVFPVFPGKVKWVWEKLCLYTALEGIECMSVEPVYLTQQVPNTLGYGDFFGKESFQGTLF